MTRERRFGWALVGDQLQERFTLMNHGWAPALALTLILKATTSYRLKEKSWKAADIDFSPRTRCNTTWMVSGLALALVLVALVTPSVSIYRLAGYARNLSQHQRDQELTRSLGLEAALGLQETDAFTHERLAGLLARHLIGSGPEMSQQTVMAITIEEPVALVSRPRYWRPQSIDYRNRPIVKLP